MILKLKKEMLISFMISDKFFISVSLIENGDGRNANFKMIVKENGRITIEINREEIKDNSENTSIIMNNLLSSRKIVDEFPILKQLEKKLQGVAT